MEGMRIASFGTLDELVSAIEKDLVDIRESLDMHQFCSYWGAYDIFSYISDCICLVHGTVGCMANRRFLPVMGSSEPCEFDPQYSTNFSEHDVVFGGEVKLKQAIEDINKQHSPSLIAVITNCCADIIGDDVGGVVNSLKELSKKTVWLHTGGYTGKSYRVGSEEAFKKLVDVMEDRGEVPVKKGTVNVFLRRWIWGDTQKSEITEAVRLMEKMGLEVNQVFYKGKTLDEFVALREAEANVAFCFYFGMSLFEEMNQRFGTKMIKASTPVGLTATLDWMKQISERMDVEFNPDSDKEVAQLLRMKEELTDRLDGRHALIWTQTGERMIGMTKLALDLNLKPVVVGIDPAVVRDKLKMFRKEIKEGFNPLISIVNNVEDVRSIATQLDRPIIFCNDDFFPEYSVFKYRYAQNQVYGLQGARLMYDSMNRCLDKVRSRYALTSEVVN